MANPILVIDNDPATARIVEEQLGLSSLGVLAVTSLVEGVEIARRRPPCLVFLNISMTDAADVARHLKEQLDSVVLVLLLQENSEPVPDDLPADIWMSKPLELQDVRRVVGSISQEVAALPPPKGNDDIRRRDPRRNPQPETSPSGLSNDRSSPSPPVVQAPLARARDDPGHNEPAPLAEEGTMSPQSEQLLEAAQLESQQLTQRVQGLEARLNVARTKHYEQVAAIQVLESRAKLLEDEALEKSTALRNAHIEQASLQKELESLRDRLENGEGSPAAAAAVETTADVVLLKAELKAANDQLDKARGAAEAQWAEAKARVSEAQGRSQKAADAAAQAAQAAELVAQHVKAMDKRLKAAVSRATKSEKMVAELREAADHRDAMAIELAAAQETVAQLRDALAQATSSEEAQQPSDPSEAPARLTDKAHERSDLERKEDKRAEVQLTPSTEVQEPTDGSPEVAAPTDAVPATPDDAEVVQGQLADEVQEPTDGSPEVAAPTDAAPATPDDAEVVQGHLAEQLATAQRERDELASIVEKLKSDLQLPVEEDIEPSPPQHPAPPIQHETEPTDEQWRAGYYILQAENAVLRQNITRLESAGGEGNSSIQLVLDDLIRVLRAQREDFEKEVTRWRESRSALGEQVQRLMEVAQSVPALPDGEVTLDGLMARLRDGMEVADRAIDMAEGLLEEQHDALLQRRQA